MKIGTLMNKICKIAQFAQEEQDSVVHIISRFHQQIRSYIAMRVEEFQKDNLTESSVDEEMVDLNNRVAELVSLSQRKAPISVEASQMIDKMQFLLQQMTTFTNEMASMKKELKKEKVEQENVHDCADDKSSNEPDSYLPDDICDGTNIESCEVNIHDRDQKIDSETAAAFCAQSCLQLWKVGENVEFQTWTGDRKWVPGRIEQFFSCADVRSFYAVRRDTGELESCVFAHELRSIQLSSSIPNNQKEVNTSHSVNVSSHNDHDCAAKKMNETEEELLRLRWDRALERSGGSVSDTLLDELGIHLPKRKLLEHHNMPNSSNNSTISSNNLNLGTSTAPSTLSYYCDDSQPFPVKLFDLVSQEEKSVVDWTANGTGFYINNMEKFVNMILPKYFNHNSYTSFERQLNLHGFRRIISYVEGRYFHPLFQEGERDLAKIICCVLEPGSEGSTGYFGDGEGDGDGDYSSSNNDSAFELLRPSYLTSLPASAAVHPPSITPATNAGTTTNNTSSTTSTSGNNYNGGYALHKLTGGDAAPESLPNHGASATSMSQSLLKTYTTFDTTTGVGTTKEAISTDIEGVDYRWQRVRRNQLRPLRTSELTDLYVAEAASMRSTYHKTPATTATDVYNNGDSVAFEDVSDTSSVSFALDLPSYENDVSGSQPIKTKWKVGDRVEAFRFDPQVTNKQPPTMVPDRVLPHPNRQVVSDVTLLDPETFYHWLHTNSSPAGLHAYTTQPTAGARMKRVLSLPTSCDTCRTSASAGNTVSPNNVGINVHKFGTTSASATTTTTNTTTEPTTRSTTSSSATDNIQDMPFTATTVTEKPPFHTPAALGSSVTSTSPPTEHTSTAQDKNFQQIVVLLLCIIVVLLCIILGLLIVVVYKDGKEPEVPGTGTCTWDV